MSWGKGDHEKPNFDDYKEYSIPFPILEQKEITQVSCGYGHVMAKSESGRLFGWGAGDFGCLGLTLMALLCIPRALFTAFHQTVRAVAGKIQSLVAMTTQTFSIFK